MVLSIMLYIISIIVTILTCTCLGSDLQEDKIIFKDENDSRSEDSFCNTPNGGRGKCVDIRACPILLSLVTNSHQHEFLKQTTCGWNQDIPMVCCNNSWNCTTPNSEVGHCVRFTSCTSINDILKKFSTTQESMAYLQNLRCGSDNICCTLFENQDIIPANTMESNNCEMSSIPPDPLSECCGRDSSANRIIGGEPTSIDQYPWTAAIEYVRNNTIKVQCGGTLISGIHVVTAAHCLFNKAWTPINVRLGDYDIDNPGEDCVEVEGGGEDCTEEPVIIAIAKAIPHPDYNPSSREKANDIAIIKLHDTAPYTDFIRPICLPTSDFTKSTTVELKVAGWGASDDIRNYSPIKLHVQLPLVNQQDCFQVFRRLNISIGEGQICAGGEKGKDSCKGDSGGALMLIKEQMTEIAGVTSFGFTPCGLENKPAVYTKIHHYLLWIKSIIG